MTSSVLSKIEGYRCVVWLVPMSIDAGVNIDHSIFFKDAITFVDMSKYMIAGLSSCQCMDQLFTPGKLAINTFVQDTM